MSSLKVPPSTDFLIDKFEHYISLYDFYENLFTEKQKEYFRSYYFYDLSLSEIANNYHISRSAIFDAINKMHISLYEYEEKLGLYKKNEIRKKVYQTYMNKAQEQKNELTLEFIEKLKEIE